MFWISKVLKKLFQKILEINNPRIIYKKNKNIDFKNYGV